MQYRGVIHVHTKGKVIIPPKILEKVGINQANLIEFALTNGCISLKKKTYTCLVTGETNDNVRELLPGIYLSEEGMRRVLE